MESLISYNKEQLEFIQSKLQDCKLLGIPGGGKTASIIGKVIYHIARTELKENNQFLILTFSRRACDDFIQKGKKKNKKLFTLKNIRTLHSIAGKIVFHILEKKSSSQDTIIISAIDLIEQNQSDVLIMPEFSNLKVIFIDEAQDISEIQYKLIMKIKELTKCKVIMIGDPNQNIYQFQKGSDQYLLNHPGKNFYLIQNYRSTPHIVRLINEFRPWQDLTPKMISTKNSDSPKNKKPVMFSGTADQIIEDIIAKILTSQFPRESIAIIGPVKKSKPNYDSYTNIGLSLFTNILHSRGIPYIKHYDDTTKDNEFSTESLKITEGHINLFTIHGSKGLEFDQVFLLNFHTNTFGAPPTKEKYKEFKYLWYVGLSRAAYDLNIYVDRAKLPWYEAKECPEDLYECSRESKLIFRKDLVFTEEIEPVYYTVSDILYNKKNIDETMLFQLENMFEFKIEEIDIFSGDTNTKGRIKNQKEYAALYGQFIENIFNYYYHLKFNKVADFVEKLSRILNSTIIVPKAFIRGFKYLKIRCPFILNNLIQLLNFHDIKNLFNEHEEGLYSYLCDVLGNNYDTEFFLDCENDVSNYSKQELESIIKNLSEGINITSNIFKITIFYYQRENETAYLWDVDFTEELSDLEPYIRETAQYAANVCEEYSFHPIIRHTKLPLVGEVDMINNDKLIDIKFTNSLSVKHILQVIIYNNIISPNFEKRYQLEIWNFKLGKRYEIHLNFDKLRPKIYDLLKLLGKSINKKLQNMIFFYDLETTGLLYVNKQIDIIDRHFEEFGTNIVISSGLIKPVFIPFIPFEITKLTGITKDMLDDYGDDYGTFFGQVSDAIESCDKPIFIAHNGNSFDHKILIGKNLLSRDKCRFLDSKMIIRLFLKNKEFADKSLVEIFGHLFNFVPVAHRANADVKMLISIFRKLNITEEKILNIL
jgi:DNA polymerase III epsilon subunit-like protein